MKNMKVWFYFHFIQSTSFQHYVLKNIGRHKYNLCLYQWIIDCISQYKYKQCSTLSYRYHKSGISNCIIPVRGQSTYVCIEDLIVGFTFTHKHFSCLLHPFFCIQNLTMFTLFLFLNVEWRVQFQKFCHGKHKYI